MKPGVTMEGQDLSGLLPAEVRSVVMELAIRNQKLPVEPALDKESGEIIEKQDGCIINVDSSVKKVLSATSNQQLRADKETIYARYSGEDLKRASQTLAYFDTWFTGSYQRYNNICLAAASINNSLLWPGQVLSFNEAVGPRTPERGYQPAPVILMGTTDLDYGGGICQVSSTVFNAAEKAGLKIIECHRHTKSVSYVPSGRDAAVSYGGLDLKFINNFSGPVIVKAGVKRGRVWAEIKGEGKQE